MCLAPPTAVDGRRGFAPGLDDGSAVDHEGLELGPRAAWFDHEWDARVSSGVFAFVEFAKMRPESHFSTTTYHSGMIAAEPVGPRGRDDDGVTCFETAPRTSASVTVTLLMALGRVRRRRL